MFSAAMLLSRFVAILVNIYVIQGNAIIGKFRYRDLQVDRHAVIIVKADMAVLPEDMTVRSPYEYKKHSGRSKLPDSSYRDRRCSISRSGIWEKPIAILWWNRRSRTSCHRDEHKRSRRYTHLSGTYHLIDKYIMKIKFRRIGKRDMSLVTIHIPNAVRKKSWRIGLQQSTSSLSFPVRAVPRGMLGFEIECSVFFDVHIDLKRPEWCCQSCCASPVQNSFSIINTHNALYFFL